MKGFKLIGLQFLGLVGVLFVLNLTLFLGLQVSTLLGNVGLVVTPILFLVWIYWIVISLVKKRYF